MTKPTGAKAYGSIPHLSGSRLGPKDYMANPGHEQILTLKARKGDRIIVEEKLDGGCCAVANVGGEIIPITRSGHRAEVSTYRQHHVFAAWTYARQHRFARSLRPGQRLVGEWLVMAHGTRYAIADADLLLRPFDLMEGVKRAGRAATQVVAAQCGLTMVPLLHADGPIGIEAIVGQLPPDSEGAVWRCENDRYGVEFLAKYVRPGKVDGCLLAEKSGGDAVWNFDPVEAAA